MKDTDYDTIGYAIGSKNVMSDTGEKTTLVFVAVRGGGYGIEWGGDFRVGTGKTHEGFDIAHTQVVEGIENYFAEHSGEFLPECKIWIVGYSRGAATANLVAKDLDDQTLSGVNIKPENVYAFCFECPRNTREEDVSDSKYKNIINIANPIDFVTKVAMASPSLTWGYNRYGTTLYLPYDLGGKNFPTLWSQMNSEYYHVTGEKMSYAFGQALILDDFMCDLATSIGTPATYTLLDQQAFMEFAAKFLGEGKKIDISDEDVLAIPSLAFMLKYHLISTLQVGELYLLGTFKSAHYAELCLAWLNSLDGDIKSFANPVYRKVFVNCPVDVSVYDSNDNLVAHISDDDIKEIENCIFAYIDENGQKILALPADEEYRIEMTATNDGTVTYTATEYNIDSGTTDKLIGYYEIDVAENDTLVGLVENLETVPSAQYPLYLNGIDKPLTPSVDQNGSAVQELTVEVSKSGNGTITGGGIYVSGEFAKVTAIADTGATFLGWYEDNVLVSSNTEYRFLVNKDVRLIAKFTETPDSPDTPVTPAPSYPPIDGPSGTSNPDNPATYNITIRTVSNGKVTATPTSAAKGTIVTLTATPDSGYELSSFTVADSKGNELKLTDKGDGKYTFTMPDSAVTVDAVFQPVPVPEGSQVPWVNPFTDVAEGTWYYDAVKYVSEKGLMNGTGSSLFSPDATTTRAMIWTILARLNGVDTSGGNPWYEKSQDWATANQISDGTAPDASITREQLITMLWRYKGNPNTTADLSRFADSGAVSDWAKDAIEWAVSTDLLQGSDSKLDPTGIATRAQVATILQRYCETLA